MSETPDTPKPITLPDDVMRTPEDVDLLDDLTVVELDVASRQLKEDIAEAVGGAQRWRAFALIAWLWHKRSNPQAKLQPYLDLTGRQIAHVVRFDDEPADQAGDTAAGDSVEANPTDSAPAS